MDYNTLEKQSLDYLGRTDFKAIKKNEIVNITSMLNNMRPEVAMEAIKQFPELSKLLRESVVEYKGVLDKIVESDDESVRHVYDIANKAMGEVTVGRERYYQFAERIHADYSKCLDKDNITPEERTEILNSEKEILRMVGEEEKEMVEKKEKIVNIVDRKDSEKRQFNWVLISAASAVLITIVGVGIAALGGKVVVNPSVKK